MAELRSKDYSGKRLSAQEAAPEPGGNGVPAAIERKEGKPAGP